jgi:DNA replication protein DnaC
METKIKCKQCNDTGWIILEEDGVNKAVRCSCYLNERSKRLLARANIPKRYKHCSIENFDIPTYDGDFENKLHGAKTAAKMFVDDYPVVDLGIIFSGSCGVGKTHLAVAIIKELIENKGAVCLFYDYRDLLRDIQDSFNPVSQTSQMAVLQPVLKAEVLVIDELGSRRSTDWIQDTMTHILNSRFNDKKINIITTNFLENPTNKNDISLEERIGSRLLSKLHEMCLFIEMKGKDYRKLKADKKKRGFKFIED